MGEVCPEKLDLRGEMASRETQACQVSMVLLDKMVLQDDLVHLDLRENQDFQAFQEGVYQAPKVVMDLQVTQRFFPFSLLNDAIEDLLHYGANVDFQ